MATIPGSPGNDNLVGTDGKDTIRGFDGSDDLFGRAGNDLLDGGPGDYDDLYGEEGNDTLKGGDGNDNSNGLQGGSGNDSILGEGGNDELYGETGSDTLNGGSGDDFLDPGSGRNESILGGTGSDTIKIPDYSASNEDISIVYTKAADGAITPYNNTFKQIERFSGDVIRVGSGNDIINVPFIQIPMDIFGGEGNDFLKAGSSDYDDLYGEEGNDTLRGGSGDDYSNGLQGGSGNDFLLGEGGNDKLYGESGSDTLNGGPGNDFLDPGSGRNESILGGTGSDTIKIPDYSFATQNISIVYTKADNGEIKPFNNTFEQIEKFSGDVIRVGSGNDIINVPFIQIPMDIFGGEGNDFLKAGSSDYDDLYGEEGNDTLRGGSGDDYSNGLQGGSGNDSLLGEGGNDVLYGESGSDTLNGGPGDDFLDPGSGSNEKIIGGTGSDTIKIPDYSLATQNISIIYTKVDNGEIKPFNNTFKQVERFAGDVIRVGLGNDQVNVPFIQVPLDIFGGEGNDFLKAGSSDNDDLYGEDGNDTLRGGAGDDDYLGLQGGVGNDSLLGEAGNDELLGQDGRDTLIGGSGNDTLTGGSGADDFVFNSTSDQIDTLTDFTSGSDNILVKKTGNGFGNFLSKGTLPNKNFRLGVVAQDKNDYLIYNPTNGELFFDVDGTGNIGQVKLATLSGAPTLLASDIFVF